MDKNPHNLVGYVHQPPMVMNGTSTAPWDAYTGRKIQHAEPIKLLRDKWTIIYSDQDTENANKALEGLQGAAKSFGIKVEEPWWCEVDGRDARQPNGKGFTQVIDSKNGPLA